MTVGADPRLRDYLGHILEAVERIQRYTADLDKVGFQRAEQTQDAVIRNFEIIGEASRNIERRYPDFARTHSNVPWGFAYEMRNALSHCTLCCSRSGALIGPVDVLHVTLA